ncbi:aspartate/glutamate racemase family protein [Peristeroidobacter soli]|uniref:aspartate/glutamate racemase family protein n=1 Tax=Peristeroidobacter soli TaxID=2497877 RepID=UPI00101CA087|nr:aspartate/glutamate racemase family protein [Peristeroidobacter soli]
MKPGESCRGPRIALIHALAESLPPIHQAFAQHWPEAITFDVFDSSLARDLAHAGKLDQSMIDRFLTLGRYAAASEGEGGRTAAILFTCSAFGPAIDAVKAALPMPVLRPNEATFNRALDMGRNIGLMVTFPPSLPALEAELRQMAAERGVEVSIASRVIDGALAALKSGDGETHDQLAAAVAADMPSTDCLILGQFSLAQAAPAVQAAVSSPVLTTPRTAVEQLRSMLTAGAP